MTQRLTYREPAAHKAWQRQIRESYLHEGAPDVDLSLKSAMVRPVSRRFAEQIILKYEWLGTMSTTSLHFGIFFGDHCAGVTCVGGANATGGANAHQLFEVERDEYLVLARGANVHWSPTGANSKLVSYTVKLLAKMQRYKVLIAYSDTDAGEIGTIYQACNWNYIGRGSSTTQLVAPNGRVYDMKKVSDTIVAKNLVGRVTWSEMRDLMVANGWREQKSNPKHRYCAILDKKDKRLCDLIESMTLPYPKRADS